MNRVAAMTRGATAAAILPGALLCKSLVLLLLAWAGLIWVAVRARVIGQYANLVVKFLLPLTLSAALIRGFVNPQLKDYPWQSKLWIAGGWAVTDSLRIAITTAAAQICLLPLAKDGRIIGFLRSWQLPARIILIVTAGITVLSELEIRTRQALEARLAQGLSTRSRSDSIGQIRFLLMPVMIASLESAAARAHLWYVRNLVERLSAYEAESTNTGPGRRGWLMLCVACGWSMVALWSWWQSI